MEGVPRPVCSVSEDSLSLCALRQLLLPQSSHLCSGDETHPAHAPFLIALSVLQAK